MVTAIPLAIDNRGSNSSSSSSSRSSNSSSSSSSSTSSNSHRRGGCRSCIVEIKVEVDVVVAVVAAVAVAVAAAEAVVAAVVVTAVPVVFVVVVMVPSLVAALVVPHYSDIYCLGKAQEDCYANLRHLSSRSDGPLVKPPAYTSFVSSNLNRRNKGPNPTSVAGALICPQTPRRRKSPGEQTLGSGFRAYD